MGEIKDGEAMTDSAIAAREVGDSEEDKDGVVGGDGEPWWREHAAEKQRRGEREAGLGWVAPFLVRIF